MVYQTNASYNDGYATWSVSQTGNYYIVVRVYDILNRGNAEWAGIYGVSNAEAGNYVGSNVYHRYFWGKSANFGVTSGNEN